MVVVYDGINSVISGSVLWVPLKRLDVIDLSWSQTFPIKFIGIVLAVIVWGAFEAFNSIFIAENINRLFKGEVRGWLAPGPVIFAVLNGLVHLSVGQGLEGFLTGFLSGYMVTIISSLTGNAWGGIMIQILTNSTGRL